MESNSEDFYYYKTFHLKKKVCSVFNFLFLNRFLKNKRFTVAIKILSSATTIFTINTK